MATFWLTLPPDFTSRLVGFLGRVAILYSLIQIVLIARLMSQRYLRYPRIKQASALYANSTKILDLDYCFFFPITVSSFADQLMSSTSESINISHFEKEKARRKNFSVKMNNAQN